jgi:2,4-dienoyl-CoA reductase-like NADH-dependent reductase (Old Yellow Enzyme family)
MSATVDSAIHLFSPLQQRTVTLPNRIAVSPMCMYSAVDGFAQDFHFVHLGSRAIGGAGLVMTEAAAVSPEGRITPGDLGIWRDEHIDKLADITGFIKEHGSVPAIQLAHAGRKASMTAPWIAPTRYLTPGQGGWDDVVGPSTAPYADNYAHPHAITREDMSRVRKAFVAATTRSVQAGFLVAEIHAAHGYLLHEFLSPLSNLRTDDYGGTFENRARFPLEVVRAVREAWPADLPLWVRVSATDWFPGGWDIDETVEFASLLKREGVDLVDASSGGNEQRQQIPAGPGYQLHFADRIRREAQIATGAVGFITEPAQADQIIRSGQADVTSLAREMLRDPYWPLRAAQTLQQPIAWPVQYERAAAGKVPRRMPLKHGESE